MRNSLMIHHFFVVPLGDADQLTRWLVNVQRILGETFTRLDDRDPQRRKSTSVEEDVQFILACAQKEQVRWIAAKAKRGRIMLGIEHARLLERPNLIDWILPIEYIGNLEKCLVVKSLFLTTSQMFPCTYSSCDQTDYIVTRTNPFGAVDAERELGGIFWLTYFGPEYVSFFGKDKFEGQVGVEFDSCGGVQLTLAESPNDVTTEMREFWINRLGKHSFVDPDDRITIKRPGQYALTIEQLQSFSRKPK